MYDTVLSKGYVIQSTTAIMYIRHRTPRPMANGGNESCTIAWHAIRGRRDMRTNKV